VRDTEVDSGDQWRNKVAVGPRASIPKGPPLPKKNLKNSVGQILNPPQRWARVHCTPCTPYCYDTGGDLYASLGEAEPLTQLLPHERVRVVGLVEESLQLGQLVHGEVPHLR